MSAYQLDPNSKGRGAILVPQQSKLALKLRGEVRDLDGELGRIDYNHNKVLKSKYNCLGECAVLKNKIIK